jgi:hypothetical protein
MSKLHLKVEGNGYLGYKDNKVVLVATKAEAHEFNDWEVQTLKSSTVKPEALDAEEDIEEPQGLHDYKEPND